MDRTWEGAGGGGGGGWVKAVVLVVVVVVRVGGVGTAGTEVPLPPSAGQGQVMRARERVGPPGMACALGSPGVQGSSAVTLNQNRRLPFERLEGRGAGGQINTKVGRGVLHGHEAQQTSLTPVPPVDICVCLCVSLLPPLPPAACDLPPSCPSLGLFVLWLYSCRLLIHPFFFNWPFGR